MLLDIQAVQYGGLQSALLWLGAPSTLQLAMVPHPVSLYSCNTASLRKKEKPSLVLSHFSACGFGTMEHTAASQGHFKAGELEGGKA